MSDTSSSTESGTEILTRMLTEQPARLPRKMRAAGYDGADAEDLAQEALVKAVRSIATLRGPATEALVCGWVDTIANNLVTNNRRDKARQPAEFRLDNQEEHAADVADVAEEIASLSALRSLLDTLPTEQRRVFVAKVVDEQSTSDIARDLGISQDLVRWRLRRARARLRAELAWDDPPADASEFRRSDSGPSCEIG